MIDKLKSIIEENIDKIKDKLITEINVEFPENKILYNSFFTKKYKDIIINELAEIYKYLKILKYDKIKYLNSLLYKSFNEDNIKLKELIEENEKAINFLSKDNDKNINQNYIYKLSKINNDIDKIYDYVISNVIIINGDGGTGKTHLLTKIAKDLINENVPAIILYGQSICDIEKHFKYLEKKMNVRDLFSTIDTIAKNNNDTGIILFDAINEVKQNEIDVINFLINSISGKKIKLIISYRNGDVDQNALLVLNKYPKLTLYGFSDIIEAAVKFSEHYNIEIGEILESDFAENPLILKIFCEEYKDKIISKGQRGYNAATYIYERYFIRISQKIVDELGINSYTGKVITGKIFWKEIAKEMAQLMVKNNRTYLFYIEFVTIINNMNLNVNSSRVIEKLIIHKLIEFNIMYLEEGQVAEIYKFAFQRQSDFLIARYLLNTKTEYESWKDFLNKKSIIEFLKENRTIIETLVEHIPIRTQKELYEFLDEEKVFGFNYSYILGLRYRSKESFGNNINQKRDEITKFIKSIEQDEYWFDWKITISSSLLVTYHPLNTINYFSELMKQMKNNERDIYLKDFLKISIVRTRIISILKIPYYANINNFSDELKLNFIHLFFWLLSVPDREVRDKASKAITAFFEADLKFIDELIPLLETITDQYIIERFIASVYSAHILNNNDALLKEHYLKIKDIFYNQTISNIRIRHYLMLLNNLCFDRKIINEIKEFKNICKKPKLKIEYISHSNFEKLMKKTGEINSVRLSLEKMGDFKRYIIENRIKDFVFEDKNIFELYKKEKIDFLSKLNNKQIELYKKMNQVTRYIRKIEEKENINLCDNLEELILIPKYISTYEKEFQNSLSEREKNIFKNIDINIQKCLEKKIPEELYISVLLKKMYKLGYNEKIELIDRNSYSSYDRHEHRVERIGKKYQWIAFYELLGECICNLQIKKNSMNEYNDFVEIDIDLLQYKNQEDKIYEFYDSYKKEIKNVKIDWKRKDFNKVYDNLKIIDALKTIYFEGKNYIPIYISENIINDEENKKCYYRLNTFININLKKINKEELINMTMDTRAINYKNNLYEIHNKKDDIKGGKFKRIWNEVYIESDYDCSNINITKDSRNRTYMLLNQQIIQFLSLDYNYSGIYRDNNGIAVIQSPFDSKKLYLYVREDLYKKIVNEFNIIISIYSEKEYKTNNPMSFTGNEICCEIDAAYKYENDEFKLIAFNKRYEENFNE